MKETYLNRGRMAQKRQTREKILQAATVILRQGSEFTLEKVAEQAGVSRATIYRYYSDKDVLSAETVLDMRTTPPEIMVSNLKSGTLPEILVDIQRYYNGLTEENEGAFRKYLSVILNSDKEINRRGGRRIQALQAALDQKGKALPESELRNFVHIATLLMGIEAFIVMKDVCGLNTQDSKKTLEWGLQKLMQGL